MSTPYKNIKWENKKENVSENVQVSRKMLNIRYGILVSKKVSIQVEKL